MTTLRTRRRVGYTLLEMSLALAIALIILGAVYEFLNRQIALGEIGRNMTEEAALARALLDQMATDISGNLGGNDPLQVSSDATQSGSSSATTTSSAATSSTTTASASTPSTTTQPTTTPFNIGVSGTDTCLILSSSLVPRELVAYDKLQIDSSQLSPVSDIRRISYWFINDSANGGLAKQEVVSATGSDLATTPPDVDNPTSLIIASEVKNVLFEYFDGTDWQSAWDGTTMSGDGMTPIGPPAAIRITLTLRSRDGLHTTDYQHVVALPGGNNFAAQKNGL